MKVKNTLGFSLLILFSAFCFADSNPAFWLAQKGEQKIWLLGSVHVGKPDLYPLPAKITQIWQQADTAIFEANTALPPENIQSLMNSDQPTNLEQNLNASEFSQLNSFAQQNQIPTEMMGHIRPWFLALMIQQKVVQDNGYDPSYGLDQHFMTDALSTNKPTQFLETSEQQLQMLANMGSLEYKFLAETLSQMPQESAELTQLVEAWRRGDYQAVVKVLDDETTDPQLKAFVNNTILIARNQQWMNTLITQQNAFVVVGSLHLYGPQGLLELLKNQQYQITRIN